MNFLLIANFLMCLVSLMHSDFSFETTCLPFFGERSYSNQISYLSIIFDLFYERVFQWNRHDFWFRLPYVVCTLPFSRCCALMQRLSLTLVRFNQFLPIWSWTNSSKLNTLLDPYKVAFSKHLGNGYSLSSVYQLAHILELIFSQAN